MRGPGFLIHWSDLETFGIGLGLHSLSPPWERSLFGRSLSVCREVLTPQRFCGKEGVFSQNLRVSQAGAGVQGSRAPKLQDSKKLVSRTPS